MKANKGRSLRIPMSDGVNLYAEIAEVGSPVWIVMTHGVGEHSGRHQYLFQNFSEHFNVLNYDLRGHGQSEGKRGDIKNFSQYRFDLSDVLAFLQKTFRMERFILMGHSMGSLIVCDYVHHLKEFKPERVFLSAPPIGVSGLLGKVLGHAPKLTRHLAASPVSLPLRGLVDLHKLSHDALVFENYITDKLNCLSLHTRLLLGLIDTANSLFQGPLNYDGPIASSIGTEDEIVSLEVFREYMSKYGSQIQVQYVEGAYHEMHNEIEKYRKQYFSFLKEFIYASLDSRPSLEQVDENNKNLNS